MTAEMAVLRDKGALTLPASLRRRHNFRTGDAFSVIDLGDGAFVLSRRGARVDELGDRVAQMISEAGYTIDELMTALEEEREQYYAEHYEKQE